MYHTGVDFNGGRLCMRGSRMYVRTVLSVHFCCTPKTALKIKSTVKSEYKICYKQNERIFPKLRKNYPKIGDKARRSLFVFPMSY